jgi:cyclic beta-1,2-glucan synthetase
MPFRFRATRAHSVPTDDLLAGPLRGELLGADHLAAHARALARAQRISVSDAPLRPARLLARLASTRRVLMDAHATLLASQASDGSDPAAAWLLDHYQAIQGHLREIRESLPGHFYRELPELSSGPLTGYPRVYEIVMALVSHTEARISPATTEGYVTAFQSVTPLTTGELWALPAMLRLGLVENVRRLTLRSVQRLNDGALASTWAARLLDASERGGTALRLALRDFADSPHAMTPHFVAQLLQSVRQASGRSPALVWLEHWLQEAGASPETAVAKATQRLALTQLMMANSIMSLRDISGHEWRAFVERQSAMEAELRRDPAAVYGQMSFATRDRYRHAVERIAKGSGHSEVLVAQWAVALARAHAVPANGATDVLRSHIGYFLIDAGVVALEHSAGYAPTAGERLARTVRAHPTVVFLGGLVGGTVMAMLAAGWLVGHTAHPLRWLVLLVLLLPALDIALSGLHQVVTLWLPPEPLARLDFQERGIPANHRTAVVMPVLLDTVADAARALERLEVQYLANRGSHLIFAVLSDMGDATTESRPDDAAVLHAACEGIQALNARYAAGAADVFALLHRPRRWNGAQGVWMGWERKRGKLADLNQLIRTGDASRFSVVTGSASAFRGIQYVITLDADTMLPRGAAVALVGAMAHPLNHAVYDARRKRTVRGFGILQPRVEISLPSAYHSRFALLASGQPGVDPYAAAGSDVYQDLYGEGSYTGKGIYDVEAFERATEGRFPENTLLSHDLIEGSYARAGLMTDVSMYDDYPATYAAYSRRKHRWIRGDWQLLPWLHRRIPGPEGEEPNRLSFVSRWKIVDNLRRSLLEVSQLLLLAGGWTMLPGSAFRWTLLGLGTVAAPWLLVLLRALLTPPFGASWRGYYRAVLQEAWTSVGQAGMALTFLPHQAAVAMHAIGITLYRLLVSRRGLLTWQPSANVEREATNHPDAAVRPLRTMTMVVAVLAASGAAWAVRDGMQAGTPAWEMLGNSVPVGLLVALWLSAPAIASRFSRSVPRRALALTATARATATRYAERHWQYFDRFVTEESRGLAPDNFQETPAPVVAMRTSPTNIGLQLLATVSAHDLGLLAIAPTLDRLERACDTLDALPRFRGHWYNWYDLTTGAVLEPAYISTVDSGNLAGHLLALREACHELSETHPLDRRRLMALADRADAYVAEMAFGFLYDPARELFAIGYHPATHSADGSWYDLLASESRLASFLAIAKHEVPLEHWARLSRALTRTHDGTALASWTGSMFEYLMPALVMRSLPRTLLHHTYEGAVARQIAYGVTQRVPWGVSESAFNVRDAAHTYQYRAFGVPDLALMRGLGRELVVAPYATLLALRVAPGEALDNLRRLEDLGALGPYGFRDALDFTRPEGDATPAVVSTYMAHHVGMTLVALTNALCDDVWVRRFHRHVLVQSADVLLHERYPRRIVPQRPVAEPVPVARQREEALPPVVREVTPADLSEPRVALLGSAAYSVMLNHTGSGYARYGNLMVTRWRSDSTRDDCGQYCYVHDLTARRLWSVGHQPVAAPADWSRVGMAPGRVTLDRADGDIVTRTEVAVMSEDAADVRRITLSNTGDVAHVIELTSYAEVAMTTAGAANAHPAFSNLFVETEWHAWCTAVTATRRPRSASEERLWCVHVVDAGPHRVGTVTCETDRARFIGRGRSVRNPQALDAGGALSGTIGPVLDPIMALRSCVRVEPGHSVSVTFTTLVAASREAAFQLAGRYHEPHAAQRALEVAWSTSQGELQALEISSASVAVFQDLASQLLYRGTSFAPPPDLVMRNRGSQARLWAYGISGDVPIVLATIGDMDGLPTLRELVLAHGFWRSHGIPADLVIVNTHPSAYRQELHDHITALLADSPAGPARPPSGGNVVRHREAFSESDFLMLSATARLTVPCDGRSLTRAAAAAEAFPVAAEKALAGQAIGNIAAHAPIPSALVPPERPGALASLVSVLRPIVAPFLGRDAPEVERTAIAAPPLPALAFANGIGGMDATGRYHLVIDRTHRPPAPWANVVANPSGGFVVSETGAGSTWFENAHFFRLTPWHNDPVSDPSSDVLYVQDRDSGDVWSPTPAPMTDTGTYHVCHAPGESSFDHMHDGIRTELRLGMPPAGAVRLSLLRISNCTGRPRRLQVTAFAEWVLGTRREETQHYVRTHYAPEHQAIIAQNFFDASTSEWAAFLAVSEPVLGYSANRESFLGRSGTMAMPAALAVDGAGAAPALDRRTGVGLDPCAALQFAVDLAPGEVRTVTVLLGAARSATEAMVLREQQRSVAAAESALAASRTAWANRLSVVQVRTPNAAFDAMLNTWTLYQSLACRMWGRAAVYQSSGAFGFRDQLQDCMALLYAEPGMAREHILRAAARQFPDGDVQHWWHAHSGRGVRTRCSDDLVWLPFVVDHYARVSGDRTIWDEPVTFLTMRPLAHDEQETYDVPEISAEQASVYEHCRRALRRACTHGAHGLPLIGSGDWNDGMSHVGADGRGESVWLAWFLVTTLRAMAGHAESRGERADAADFRQLADDYAAAIETHGWDGQWYRRAYFDDGTPVGSATSDECRIDSIAQSWSVLSGAGDPLRQAQAMRAVHEQLVDTESRVIRLLTPPFDVGTHDPGYIKGYVPGVRENGAQYTHAALWVVAATAMLGNGNQAFELFQMLNPLTHGDSPEAMARYRVEPYVVAADVYTAAGHEGRGGWTWYTGSASWMYRVGLEQLLGFTKVGATLRITPSVPDSWKGFDITYRYGRTTYAIHVRHPALVREHGAQVTLDGDALPSDVIPLADDGQEHVVVVDARRP